MVAWSTGGNSTGHLQLIDVEHDTVNNKQDTVHSYVINGYSASDPLTIQDYPGQQVAYVFSDGGSPPSSAASFQPANTATDAVQSPLAGISAGTTSAYITDDFAYVYSVSPTLTRSSVGYLTVVDQKTSTITSIPLPAANKLAPSPGAVSGSSTLLIFAVNSSTSSNNVYQLVGIGQNSLFDCTQQLNPVNGNGAPLPFDKPVNALYSSDGTSAFILNCGPECGGTTSSISIVSTTQLANGAAAAYKFQNTGCNVDPSYTPGPLSIPVQNVPIPGGVTVALQLGTTLFLAGQSVQPDGHLGGELTTLDLTTLTTTSTPIGDGHHFRMRAGDNNTLWIAATGCTVGEQAFNGGTTGCITRVPLTANSAGNGYVVIPPATPGTVVACPTTAGTAPVGPCIEPNQGDANGIAPIVGYDKTYTVEGGVVWIYSTVDGSPINNINVQVAGYAKDISFIDGTSITGP
jgi:hypothetical protein